MWSLENTGLTSQTNPDLLIWVMYNFQVRNNNLFYILYEATNLKTAGVCMARSQNSEQDDFKIMLKVQCSYFITKLFFVLTWSKLQVLMKSFLKNFCNHAPKKRNNTTKIIVIKKTANYKSHLSESIICCFIFPLSSQSVERQSRICKVPTYFLSFPFPLYFKES